MPFGFASFAVYATLMALAYRLGWRYRTWLVLLAAVSALAGVGLWWLDTHMDSARAPALAKELGRELRARSWVPDSRQVATVISFLRQLDDQTTATALERPYRLEFARDTAGERSARFATVGEAIDWGRQRPESTADVAAREIEDAERRAIEATWEVRAPRRGDGQIHLTPEATLRAGAREAAPGVWVVTGSPADRGAFLQIAIVAENHTYYSIEALDLTIEAHTRTGAGEPSADPTLFSCSFALRNIIPREIRFLPCEIALSSGDEQGLREGLDAVNRIRAGDTALRFLVTKNPTVTAVHVPPSPALLPDAVRQYTELKKADLDDRLERSQVRMALSAWLAAAVVFLLAAIPSGIRRGPLSISGTAIVALVALVVDAVALWYFFVRDARPDSWGELLAIGFFVSSSATFVAGLLFWNLVQRQAPDTPDDSQAAG